MSIEKKQRGGKRSGAGRPPAPKTKVITFRIRPAWEKRIRKVVSNEIKSIKPIQEK